jgi:hypothetical protein
MAAAGMAALGGAGALSASEWGAARRWGSGVGWHVGGYGTGTGIVLVRLGSLG